MVSENLKSVEARIQAACDRAGRKRSDVLLVCVTKTHPVELCQEAYDCGERNFGENKVQEIEKKKPLLPEDVRWHMIGHLQTNKVKQVIDKAVLIHSVDSEHLAKEISKQAGKLGITVPILVEVNAAKEESKWGVYPEDAEEFVRTIAPLPNIQVRGLMTSAPYTENPESNRQYFRLMRELCIDIRNKNIDNVAMCELSMGMTGDFEVAVEEGATIVRIGTAIFGARDYT
ncbi:MAG: YggS family pyridoxal phosphate-dependent enzyme [Lachnospiraceae bacterium]|jgi:pyridoxal phosphate enzyme (YggS family)|nr:YggS family pyridoxal phosphate-dependent enzyme [Lachnospiraceae bacterium]